MSKYRSKSFSTEQPSDAGQVRNVTHPPRERVLPQYEQPSVFDNSTSAGRSTPDNVVNTLIDCVTNEFHAEGNSTSDTNIECEQSKVNVNHSANHDLNAENVFSIVHHNVNRLLNKLDEIRVYLKSHYPATIYSCSETFLDNSKPDYLVSIEGYNIIRRDSLSNEGGGIILKTLVS